MKVLSGVGNRGIHVRLLSKQVYNLSTTLFDTPEFDEIYRYVRQYVIRNSKFSTSLIERMEKRGYYRLNPNSTEVPQLKLKFNSAEEDLRQDDNKEEKPSIDLSLNLFDFD